MNVHYRGALYRQSLVRQALKFPPREVCFSTRNGALHWGHGSGRGLSHMANVQEGYSEQLKNTFPFFVLFSHSFPEHFFSGHDIPRLKGMVFLQSG
jgi:hypothetical protein